MANYKFNTDNHFYTTKPGEVERVTVDLDSEKLSDNTHYHILLLDKSEPLLRKRLIEAIVSIYAETADSLSTSKKAYNSNLTEDSIDLQLVYILRQTSMFIGYLLNSTSWQDQELKDFDKFELKNRLQKIMQLL